MKCRKRAIDPYPVNKSLQAKEALKKRGIPAPAFVVYKAVRSAPYLFTHYADLLPAAIPGPDLQKVQTAG